MVESLHPSWLPEYGFCHSRPARRQWMSLYVICQYVSQRPSPVPGAAIRTGTAIRASAYVSSRSAAGRARLAAGGAREVPLGQAAGGRRCRPHGQPQTGGGGRPPGAWTRSGREGTCGFGMRFLGEMFFMKTVKLMESCSASHSRVLPTSLHIST